MLMVIFFRSGIYLMAANTVSGSCAVEVHLYRNDKLVGARGHNWDYAQTGVAVTECEQGETLRVRTNENTCHDILADSEDRRMNWFSVVLIAMT